jgi:cell division protein FtsB
MCLMRMATDALRCFLSFVQAEARTRQLEVRVADLTAANTSLAARVQALETEVCYGTL